LLYWKNDSKIKMSESHKGKNGYWKNKKRIITNETKKKLSISLKKYWEKRKLLETNYGL
jgi:hypothetical protein